MVSSSNDGTKPLWIAGEVLLQQRFFVNNHYFYASGPETKTDEHSNIRWLLGEEILCQKFIVNNKYIHTYKEDDYIEEKSENIKIKKKKKKKQGIKNENETISVAVHDTFYSDIPWLLGEKLLCQKFIVNNKYIHTYNGDIYFEEKSENMKIKKKKKMKKKKPRNIQHDNMTEHNENDFLQKASHNSKCLPLPGDAAMSMLNILSYFSVGLKELFPCDIVSNKLKPLVREYDQIYLMSKLDKVILQLENILQNQVADYISNNDVNICELSSRADLINEIKKSFLLKQMINADNVIKASTSKLKGTKTNGGSSEGVKNTKWTIEPEMISIIENEHFIEFIGESMFVCKICPEISFTDPSFHITTPSHIQAFSDII